MTLDGTGSRFVAVVAVVAVGWLSASIAVAAPVAAAEIGAGDTLRASAATRETVPLATGWRFRFGDADPTVTRQGFDDSDWVAVAVPHTWNRVGHYLWDPASHVNRADNVDKRQGIGWYRLAFAVPSTATGRRAWLQFDAASRVATVWLNGVKLGTHAGGFSRFRFDATQALRVGASNLLVVKTDNSLPAPGTDTAATLPYAGDFFIHGGLYRPVSLVLTDAIHVDMLDAGGPGTYATTIRADAERADIVLRTRVRNDGRSRERLTVIAELLAPAGETVGRSEARVEAKRGEVVELAQPISIPRPRLWRGVTDPYLHTLRVSVRDARGRTRDVVEQRYGVRTFAFDGERGLLLNGVPLRLRGVGYHQDREGKGWAVSAEDTAEDVAIIREMGANSIRLTHYQHGQPVHELADRYGLVLWDEIPLVTAWTLRDETSPSTALVDDAKQQLRELIRQNFNHAAVAVWGIANEVDFGRNRPDFFGKSPTGEMPDPRALLRQLHELAKAEDPSRATTLATCCELHAPPSAAVPTVAGVTDVSGANRYFGWYYDAPGDLGPHLDALHALRPKQPLAVTEYGAGGATTMHTDDARAARADSRGRMQPEEYMSLVHEENWRQLAARPYLWATWLWNSFDFATTVRREGDADDINTKGLVSYDRRIRKDPYWFYRANWTATPTVYVGGRRHVDRAYAVTDVRVYSNAPVTELAVNGRSLGTLADCPQRTCVWASVRLAAGENRVVATGRFPGGEQADSIAWRVDAGAVTAVRIDAGALMPASSIRGRFGSDAFFSGGVAGSADEAGGWGQAPKLAKIEGAADRDLTATYREGAFRYLVPVADGRHRVTLTFVEPSAAVGERVFDVLVDGRVVLARFDVAAAAGGSLRAITRTFDAVAANGTLDLEFRPSKGRAIVSAIEVER